MKLFLHLSCFPLPANSECTKPLCSAAGSERPTLSTQERPAMELESIIFSSHGLILILDTGMFSWNAQRQNKVFRYRRNAVCEKQQREQTRSRLRLRFMIACWPRRRRVSGVHDQGTRGSEVGVDARESTSEGRKYEISNDKKKEKNWLT